MAIDEQRIEFLMTKLGVSREEALDIEGYDDDVNHGRKTIHDLTPQQIANVQEMNRKKDHKKYGHAHRERKPNETKEAIIANLAEFLENSCVLSLNDAEIACSSVEITNKNRMIHFSVGKKEFDLQLIEKREPKK